MIKKTMEKPTSIDSGRGKLFNHPSASLSGDSSVSSETSNDVTLLDLVTLGWKLKSFLVGGLLVGLLVGVLSHLYVIPRSFQSRFSIPLSLESFPAIRDPKIIAKKLNSELASRNSLATLHSSFNRSLPAYKKQEFSTFMGTTQVPIVRKSDLPLSVDVNPLNGQIVVNLVSKVSFEDQASLVKSVKSALNQVIENFNNTESAIVLADRQSDLSRKEKLREKSTSSQNLGSQETRESLQRTVVDIHQFHYKYYQKLKLLSPLAQGLIQTDTSRSESESGVFVEKSENSVVLMFETASRKLAQTVTTVSFLVDAKLLEDPEVDQFHTEYHKLQFELENAFAVVSTQQQIGSQLSKEFVRAKNDLNTPIVRSETFLPMFDSNSSSLENGEFDSIEKVKPDFRIVTGSFGVFGALIAFLLGLFVVYARKGSFRKD